MYYRWSKEVRLIIFLIKFITLSAGALHGIELYVQPGPYDVGTTLVNCIDSTRIDPYLSSNQPRTLMLRIWYPILPASLDPKNHQPLPYPAEGHDVFDQHSAEFPDTPFPGTLLRTTLTIPAIQDAPPIKHRWPTIIFSHGYTMSCASNSGLCIALARQGFVVIAISHTGIAGSAPMPDGSYTTCQAPPGLEFFLHAAEDTRSVINLLITESDPFLQTIVDLDRIGMCGHSMGGVVTTHLCATSPFVKAGINLDGPLFGRALFPPFQKPFLFVLAEDFYQTFTENHPAFAIMNITQQDFVQAIPSLCNDIGPQARLITLPSTSHNSFCDFPEYLERAIEPTNLSDDELLAWQKRFRTGTCESASLHKTLSSLIISFFTLHLKSARLASEYDAEHLGRTIIRSSL